MIGLTTMGTQSDCGLDGVRCQLFRARTLAQLLRRLKEARGLEEGFWVLGVSGPLTLKPKPETRVLAKRLSGETPQSRYLR